ncbi:MAG: hypothetical protein ABL860_06785, partial [Candidatus Nitrotoga sp.]
MTNLAITGNSSQLPDSANTLQSNGSVDTRTTGTLIEPFVALLARQIDKTACLNRLVEDPPALDAGATDNSTNHAAKNTRDQDTIATNIPTDPVNTLTVALLQLPLEIREAAQGSTTPSAGSRSTSKIDPTAPNTTLRLGSSIARPDITQPNIAQSDITRPDIARPDTADSLPDNITAPASVTDKQILSVT